MNQIADKIAGLNLGSRTKIIADFLNMDLEFAPGVDVVGDVSDLSRFEGNSIGAIYASHILEHFSHPQTLAVLKEWHRVIEPGGKIYIAVPDFARAVELYKFGINQWLQEYISGGQEYKTAYHFAIFDEAKLTDLLKKAGFSDSFRVEQFPIGDDSDCSNLASNLDGFPISLNMIATK